MFLGVFLDGRTESAEIRLPGQRQHVRGLATISVLNLLRLRLLAR